MLAHPDAASKEAVIRRYDHEVQGATIVKPLVGVGEDGPSDAAVLRPLETGGWRGIALGCGINPHYGRVDPYAMAWAAVDEAVRNVVSVGGNPDRIALLDNFCWGNPALPDRLGGLVRAAQGCHDAALAYGTPFISGKDSLNNEYVDPQGEKRAIPPTLLVSSLSIVPDVRKAVTMDLKCTDDLIYIVGETRDELGGSLYYRLYGAPFDDKRPDVHGEVGPRGYPLQGKGPLCYPSQRKGSLSYPLQGKGPLSYPLQSKGERVPAPVPDAIEMMRALHRAMGDGLVRACHDLSEGGLAVAAAEMAIAGRLGLDLDLASLPRTPDVETDAVALFSESSARFLVEVAPEDVTAFEEALAGWPTTRLGRVTGDGILRMRHIAVHGVRDEIAVEWRVQELVHSFCGVR
jgi:phosphoribosylformylglycinamidine synthase